MIPRHFLMTSGILVCKRETPFDSVDQFKKHIPNCQTTRRIRWALLIAGKSFKSIFEYFGHKEPEEGF